MSEKIQVTKKKLSDYIQDSKNFNKGNPFGESLIAKSISKFGAGRSMLAASDGTLIAGNKSHQKFAEAGIENVIEVETDGKTAVVVKRTDIKSGSIEFHEMALADNASAIKNITFDLPILEEFFEDEIINEWGINKDIEPEHDENENKNGELYIKCSFTDLSEIRSAAKEIKNVLSSYPSAKLSVSGGEL